MKYTDLRNLVQEIFLDIDSKDTDKIAEKIVDYIIENEIDFKDFNFNKFFKDCEI